MVVAGVVVHARTPKLELQVQHLTTKFAPAGHTKHPRTARIEFFVRDTDPRAVVQIVGPQRQRVRTLYRGPLAAYKSVTYHWNGRTDAGKLASPNEKIPPASRAPGSGPRHGLSAGDPAPRRGRVVNASAAQFIGILIACGAAAGALLAGDARLRYGCALVALMAAPMLIAGDVWDSSRLVALRHPPEKLAVVVVVAIAGAAVVAAVFRRFPWSFPIAAFAVLPLRVPVHVGSQTSHLLVPLYVVIAGGVLCFGYAALRGRSERGDDAPPAHPATLRDSTAVVWLYRVLAATLVLYAIQSAYSVDVSNAIENASFFLVPFALLFVMLGEVRWSDRLLGWVLVTVSAVALVFAGVAFWEYAARDLLLSKGDLLASNQLHLYFRVNSLFYDPNILGRALALVLVALGAYLAWARNTGLAIAAAVVAGILLAALALSFSITGFAALIAGLLVVMALRWGIRWAVGAGVVIVAAMAIFFAVSGVGTRGPRLVGQGRRCHQRPGEPDQRRLSPHQGPPDLGLRIRLLRDGVQGQDRLEREDHRLAQRAADRRRRAGRHRPDRLRGAGGARADRPARRARAALSARRP